MGVRCKRPNLTCCILWPLSRCSARLVLRLYCGLYCRKLRRASAAVAKASEYFLNKQPEMAEGGKQGLSDSFMRRASEFVGQVQAANKACAAAGLAELMKALVAKKQEWKAAAGGAAAGGAAGVVAAGAAAAKRPSALAAGTAAQAGEPAPAAAVAAAGAGISAVLGQEPAVAAASQQLQAVTSAAPQPSSTQPQEQAAPASAAPPPLPAPSVADAVLDDACAQLTGSARRDLAVALLTQCLSPATAVEPLEAALALEQELHAAYHGIKAGGSAGEALSELGPEYRRHLYLLWTLLAPESSDSREDIRGMILDGVLTAAEVVNVTSRAAGKAQPAQQQQRDSGHGARR